ncbi:MAG TPA: uroporphyrinogen-III C-methyltransferase [Deltaproteobacteria bacterium]|nr:uroporphyrinogen-III C-methyltransferase [Deltaproteobacteria bacterium]
MKVYLIGAGPGDPELITLKARRVLETCGAVVYDDLIAREILALAPAGASRIYVGKRGGKPSMGQEAINGLLVNLARQGLVVARLKGGDPCVFGRGGEEAMHLAENGIPFEFVPGVTSAIAGPVSAGIPPTHRGMAASVTLVTAHEDPGKNSGFLDWDHLARDTGTLVFLMGASRIESIASKLVERGMDPSTPCAMIQEATTPAQRTLVSTLAAVGGEAALAGMSSPSVIVVGKVAGLAGRLGQQRNLPLSGMSVLVTRPAHQSYESAALFAASGAKTVCYPLVEIRELDFELPDPHSCDMVVFTSQNAVSIFFSRLASRGLDARALAPAKIYCIGPRTRESLKSFGIIADGMAEEFRAEGLVELFRDMDLSGLRVCLPRARGARPVLVDALRRKGARVDEITVYETVLPENASGETFLQALSEVDTVVFTSPSGVRHALELLGGDAMPLESKRIAAIGPVTAEALKNRGLTPGVTASVYTDEGIIAALSGGSS